MHIIINILRDVLSDTSNCCCLCFNAIRDNETSFCINDEVSLSIDVEATEVLHEIIYTVLGDKVSNKIITII